MVDLLKELEKNPSREYIKSWLKRFTAIEYNLLKLLYVSNYPISVGELRNQYIFYSLFWILKMQSKLLKKKQKIKVELRSSIGDAVPPTAPPLEYISPEDLQKIIVDLNKVESLNRMDYKSIKQLNKIFSKHKIPTYGDITIQKKLDYLVKEGLVIRREVVEEKTKAKALYILNPMFDVFLKKVWPHFIKPSNI